MGWNMKQDLNGNEQGISLNTETGKMIYTKIFWDRQLMPGDTFVVTQGFGSSLFLMTLDESKRYKEMIQTLSAKAIFYTYLVCPPFLVVINVEIDRYSHLMIPDIFLKHAGIEENAVIKGVGNFAQIWSGQAFDEKAFVGGVEGIQKKLILQSIMSNIGGA